jgi:XTP/dITP diphosphohydrolase
VIRLALATRNPHKVAELAALLSSGRVRPLTLTEAGLPDPDPAEEDLEPHESFAENALAKARYFAARTGLPVLADDSGLAVDALAGQPGVRSKRFSGRHDLAGDELDRANLNALLERLRGVAPPDRRGFYVCAAALAVPGAGSAVALGTLEGAIGTDPAGTGGFGYDPVFLLPGRGRTVAELSAVEKNRISHRARAFRALVPQLGPLLAAAASRPGVG